MVGGLVLLAILAIVWVLFISSGTRKITPPEGVSPPSPSSAGVPAATPTPPPDPPREGTGHPLSRRASDEELRKQLPPDATLDE